MFGVTTKGSELSFCDRSGDSIVAIRLPRFIQPTPLLLGSTDRIGIFIHGNDDDPLGLHLSQVSQAK